MLNIYKCKSIPFWQAHGGRHACAYCEGLSTFNLGRMRTFGLLRQRLAEFLAAGGRLKDAKNFYNVVRECLLIFGDSVLVLFVLPPPPLHLRLGATNIIMAVIIR